MKMHKSVCFLRVYKRIVQKEKIRNTVALPITLGPPSPLKALFIWLYLFTYQYYVQIAALSPADINYDETLSTLRYADR